MSKLRKIRKFFNCPLVVYTMGKVGSRSIVSSLIEHGTAPLDLHWLNGTYHTKKDLKFLHKRSIKLKVYEVIHDIIVKLVFKLQRKQIKVLTIIRDPIDVRHSFLFQDLHLFLYDYFETNKGTARKNSDGDFMFKIMNKYLKENYFIEHLQKEIFRVLNIKENELKFHKEEGYGFYSNNKFKVLFLTLEKLDTNINILEDFLDIELQGTKSNDSNKKWYNPLKNKFSKDISYEETYLKNFYYDNKVDLFYTNEEIDRFIEKWKK